MIYKDPYIPTKNSPLKRNSTFKTDKLQVNQRFQLDDKPNHHGIQQESKRSSSSKLILSEEFSVNDISEKRETPSHSDQVSL